MRMKNTSGSLIFLAGCLLVALSILFPPWHQLIISEDSDTADYVSIGRHFLFSHRDSISITPDTYPLIDSGLLTRQTVLLLLAIWVVSIAFGKRLGEPSSMKRPKGWRR
jgi:hypothetical protein